MSSLVTNLSTSTAQEIIVNRVTTANGCVHSADMTQLNFAVAKFVQTHRNCCESCTHIGLYTSRTISTGTAHHRAS